jgi:hypothetical protein
MHLRIRQQLTAPNNSGAKMTRYEAMRDALESARVGLRDWETPENRYKALRAIDAALAMPDDPTPEESSLVVPDGWDITMADDGAIIVRKSNIGGYVATKDSDNIASSILFALASDLLAVAPEVKPEPIRFTNRQIYEAVLAAMKECAADEPPQSFEEFMINAGQSVVFLREFIRAVLAAAPEVKP